MRSSAYLVAIMLATIFFSSFRVGASETGIVEVAVIAHSVSTSVKAREVRAAMHWAEVQPKNADFILVVCRSSLSYPLNSSYTSYGELSEDADRQLNISGPRFHIYLYRIDSDLRVAEVAHKSFEADE